MTQRISSRMRAVLWRWPATYEIFRKHGCPDMRRGLFAITARIMPLAWAARMHGVPLDVLLRERNACAARDGR